MPPFSKTDDATKAKLFNAVISDLCAPKPQDFSNTAMRAVLEKRYNDFVEGNLFHATTLPKVRLMSSNLTASLEQQKRWKMLAWCFSKNFFLSASSNHEMKS